MTESRGKKLESRDLGKYYSGNRNAGVEALAGNAGVEALASNAGVEALASNAGVEALAGLGLPWSELHSAPQALASMSLS